MKFENLSGTGDLYEGERLIGRVRYRIHATSPETDADGQGQSSGTLRPIDGPSEMAFHRELDEGTLTLDLEDGRRWPCQIESADGHAVGDGPIYKP